VFYPRRPAKSIKNQETVLRTTDTHLLKELPNNGVAIIVLSVRMCYTGMLKRPDSVET
jgi:hypothetical protein